MEPPITTPELQEENSCLMRTIWGSKAPLVDLSIDPQNKVPALLWGVTQSYWSRQSKELTLQPSHPKQTQCSHVL